MTISDKIKGKRSKCAKNIDDFKSAFVEEAKSNGVHMQQYYNTPTCDRQGFVSKMFHPKVYKWMLKTKSYWDPNNIFNHSWLELALPPEKSSSNFLAVGRQFDGCKMYKFPNSSSRSGNQYFQNTNCNFFSDYIH